MKFFQDSPHISHIDLRPLASPPDSLESRKGQRKRQLEEATGEATGEGTTSSSPACFKNLFLLAIVFPIDASHRLRHFFFSFICLLALLSAFHVLLFYLRLFS